MINLFKKKLIGTNQNIIGVIGKNGKSTIGQMIEFIFKNLHLSNDFTEVEKFLQKSKTESYENDVKNVIIEVCVDEIKHNKVNLIDFNSLIYTNSAFVLQNDEKWTKIRPFIALSISDLAIINVDDSIGKELINLTNAQTVTYGLSDIANISAKNINLAINGTSFDLYINREFVKTVRIPYFGTYNVLNTLATLAYFHALDYNLEQIFGLLEKLPHLSGKFDYFATETKKHIIIDYARNPESIETLLNSVQSVAGANIFAVVGSDAKQCKSTRSQLGKVILPKCLSVVITNDNPRDVEPQHLIYDIISDTVWQNYRICLDREKAIEIALKMMKENDTLLILGRGHENKQYIKDKINKFNDLLTAKYLVEKFSI